MGGGGPAPPDLSQEYTGELSAKAKLAPQVFQTESQFDPQYGNLNLANVSNVLTGSSDPGPAGYLGFMKDVAATTNADQATSQGQQAQGNIGNATRFGPQGVAALMAADPGEASIMSGLTASAADQANAGTSLSPAQNRQVEQSVREGQAARGMGFGPADAYGEALGVSQYGTNLWQQRAQTAGAIAGQRYSQYTAPAVNWAAGGPNNSATQYALGQGYGISSSIGPKLFGSDINAQNTFDTSYNGQVNQSIAKQNSIGGLIGGGISSLGKLYGSIL